MLTRCDVCRGGHAIDSRGILTAMKDALPGSLVRPRVRGVRACGLLASLTLLGALYGAMGAGCSDSDATSADGGPSGTSTSTATTPTGSTTTTPPGPDGSAPQDASTSTDASADAAPVDPFTGVPAATLVKDGFVFLEGPLWLAAQNKLIFSDVQGNRIYQLVPPVTTATDFRNPSGGANGNAVDKNGVLYTCEHTNHRVSRTLANGTVEPVVETFGGKKLNSPNDVIVRSDQNVYFTDPDYAADASNRQAKQNVFRVAPGGAVTVIDDTLDKPNGIALSPDQNTLYVAVASGKTVRKYPIAADGSVGAGSLFATCDGTSPDGIAVDDAGNLYAATSKGVEIFTPAGVRLGTVTVPQQPANVAFGGTDRRTLYVTARTGLYSTRTNVAGPP